MNDTDITQTKLRFRIKLLLAERDMTVANLYQLVKQQGFDISSSHFFRQMTPYPNAVRPDLLVAICKAIGCEGSELFDLVEVTPELEPQQKPKVVTPKASTPKKSTEVTVAQEIDAAKRKAEDKRKSALLGPKVAVLGLKKN
ncbi:MAG: helix-turn-helix transcriptional regulator [Methylotenera sp.]|nr:helix-turn-helix transcriptional regulator [Methylotenera sp.]MDD4925916.1 helix-turn-helix transcriptional regulator [Methylotenera sp.]